MSRNRNRRGAKKELILLDFPGDDNKLRTISGVDGRKKIAQLDQVLKQELARHTGMAI